MECFLNRFDRVPAVLHEYALGAMGRDIAAEEYDENYFLSSFLEGYDEYQRGELSVVKAKQLEMLRLGRDVSVLEVGYGRGELLLHCAHRGARITGIDYSPVAFRLAQATLAAYPEAQLHVADARDLPFSSNSFDRVFSGDVIEHVSFEHAERMLREMYRVTRPGGFMLVHTTPNTWFTRGVYPWAKHVLRLIDGSTVNNIDAHLGVMRKLHSDEYSIWTLRRVARRAGLKRFRVWIDPDLTRSNQHPHTRPFRDNFIFRLASSWGRLPLGRLLLGNDLYLQCEK